MLGHDSAELTTLKIGRNTGMGAVYFSPVGREEVSGFPATPTWVESVEKGSKFSTFAFDALRRMNGFKVQKYLWQ